MIEHFSARQAGAIFIMILICMAIAAACQPSQPPVSLISGSSEDISSPGIILHGRQPLPHFRAIAAVMGPIEQKVTLWICGFDGVVYHGSPTEGVWKDSTVPGLERLYALAAADGDRAWVAGWGGVVYRTTDGGASWDSCRTPGPERITALHRSVDGTILAVGDLGVVWKSTDGVTFSLEQRLGSHGLRSLHLNRNGRGMIVGYAGGAFMTTDAGRTWRPLETLTALNKDLYSCHVRDDDDSMWAVGSFGTLLCSRDGGQSWNSITTGNPAYHRHITFNAAIGMISGYGCVLYSTDGGLTWENIIRDHPFQYIASSIQSNGESWVCGEYGSLHHLHNGGTDARQFLLGIGVRLNAVAPIPETTTIHAVGEKGVMLTSKDSGLTWSIRLMNPMVTLTDILASEDRILIAGQAGAIFESRDQGQTWQCQKLPEETTLRVIRRQSGNRVWVCGDRGFLAYRDEDSSSWNTIRSRFATDFHDIFFFDEQHAIVVGTAGTILETNDGGAFFLANYTGIDEDLLGIAGRGQQAIVCGQAGIVMETLTGASGSSWNLHRLQNASTVKTVAFSPAGHALVAGEGGLVMVRKAHDRNWQSFSRMPRNSIENIVFVDDRTALACGSGGVVIRLEIEN